MTDWLFRRRYAPPVLDALIAFQITGDPVAAVLALLPGFVAATPLHTKDA